jgi:hypothetical protein
MLILMYYQMQYHIPMNHNKQHQRSMGGTGATNQSAPHKNYMKMGSLTVIMAMITVASNVSASSFASLLTANNKMRKYKMSRSTPCQHPYIATNKHNHDKYMM